MTFWDGKESGALRLEYFFKALKKYSKSIDLSSSDSVMRLSPRRLFILSVAIFTKDFALSDIVRSDSGRNFIAVVPNLPSLP